MNLFFTELDSYIYVYIALLVVDVFDFCSSFSQVCLLEWGIAFKF